MGTLAAWLALAAFLGFAFAPFRDVLARLNKYAGDWTVALLLLPYLLTVGLRPAAGDLLRFALYLALYAVGRFGISFLREDRIWALGLQEAHYIALLVLIATIPLLVAKARFTHRPEAEAIALVARGTRAERRRRSRRE